LGVKPLFGWLKKREKQEKTTLYGFAYIVPENGQLKIYMQWWPLDNSQKQNIDWSKGLEDDDEEKIRKMLENAVIKDVKIFDGDPGRGLWIDLETKI
jgi:hypothetical protein